MLTLKALKARKQRQPLWVFSSVGLERYLDRVEVINWFESVNTHNASDNIGGFF